MGALKNPRHEKICTEPSIRNEPAFGLPDAFPKSKSWKDTTVDSKASELFGKVVKGITKF